MKKGKEKKEENYIKKGEKGLKNASFWAINSKSFVGMIRMHNIYPYSIKAKIYFFYTVQFPEKKNYKQKKAIIVF